MDINSAACPLCKDGIGHAMDDKHAALVIELLESCKYLTKALDEYAENHSHDNGMATIAGRDMVASAIARAEGRS